MAPNLESLTLEELQKLKPLSAEELIILIDAGR
jgi:hypothetical protein